MIQLKEWMYIYKQQGIVALAAFLICSKTGRPHIMMCKRWVDVINSFCYGDNASDPHLSLFYSQHLSLYLFFFHTVFFYFRTLAMDVGFESQSIRFARIENRF